MTASLVLTAPNGQTGEVYDIETGAGPKLRGQVVAGDITLRTSPVFVEDYLAAAGGDIRTAIRNAWLANPLAGWFIYPTGSFRFVGAFLQGADGLRNGVRHTGQNTEIFDDLAGAAGGQRIFFARLETDGTHADSITWEGFKFSLYNALTSFFGAAVYFESASNCACFDCEFFCSLVPAATQGRIRWGLAFLGGTLTNGGGRKNVVDRVTTTISQIQLCGQGRDVDGVRCTNIDSTSNNDFIVSCVSSGGFNVRNVLIDQVVAHNVAGGGCIFVGSDGGSVGGVDNLENVIISNFCLDGAKSPVLDFVTAGLVIVDLGKVNRNIVVQGINTTMVSTELQCRSILIQSDVTEVSATGISVSDCNLGIVSTNDPLEALNIVGRNISGVTIDNVNVLGQRGIKLSDCDHVTITNCNTADGSCFIDAVTRNLSAIAISNCNFKRAALFSPAVVFNSTTGKSFSGVVLSNMVIDNNSSLQTTLAGGTMQMLLSNIVNVSNNNLTAETIAGIVRAVNCVGSIFVFTTIAVVAVPAVAAGSVGYLDVSLAGTRLASMIASEPIVANVNADLVAAGVGGAFVGARVSATGVARLAFLGPLAGGNFSFTFARAPG